MTGQMRNNIVAKSFSALYLQNDFADFTFSFESDDGANVEVPVHKNILAVASKVFEKMFYGPLKEGDSVKIVDADASAFKEFLQFFYLEKVTLTIRNIETVVCLTHKYDTPHFLNICSDFLRCRLTNENMLWGYRLSIKLNIASLRNYCNKRIALKPTCFIKDDSLSNCDRDVLRHILRTNTLECRERDLFDACIEWAKSNCKRKTLDENDAANLKGELGECFYMIRFGSMTLKEITGIMSDDLCKDLFSRDEMTQIFRIKSEDNFVSSIFECKERIKISSKFFECRLIETAVSTTIMQRCSSTWFSTNHNMILYRISFNPIHDSERLGETGDSIFTITLVEYNGMSFNFDERTKILHTSSVDIAAGGGTFSFPDDIYLKERTIYEICMDTKSTTKIRPFYVASNFLSLHRQIKLDDRVTIQLHQHPADSRGRASLVSNLSLLMVDRI